MSEIVVIAVVALVVIGPKDLPRTLRMVGRMAGKARDMAGEFHRHFDDMVREADLDEVKRKVEEVRRSDVESVVENAVDPGGTIRRGLELPEEEEEELAAKPPAPPPLESPNSPSPVATGGPAP
ncbi:MAG: Sec-independent protein translocase protein TatB [Alphaproteobacteria bacterium]